jgi:hypothetical protein
MPGMGAWVPGMEGSEEQQPGWVLQSMVPSVLLHGRKIHLRTYVIALRAPTAAAAARTGDAAAAAAAAEHAAARARRHGSAALTLAFPATLRVLTAPFAKLPDQLTCPRKDLFLRPACFAHQGERVGTKIDHGTLRAPRRSSLATRDRRQL